MFFRPVTWVIRRFEREKKNKGSSGNPEDRRDNEGENNN